MGRKKSKKFGGAGMAERGYKAKVIYLLPSDMDRIKQAARSVECDASSFIVGAALAAADAVIATIGESKNG